MVSSRSTHEGRGAIEEAENVRARRELRLRREEGGLADGARGLMLRLEEVEYGLRGNGRRAVGRWQACSWERGGERAAPWQAVPLVCAPSAR